MLITAGPVFTSAMIICKKQISVGSRHLQVYQQAVQKQWLCYSVFLAQVRKLILESQDRKKGNPQ